MRQNTHHALSDTLDRLESAIEGDKISVGSVVGHLGANSFASLMLVFSLVSTSPASGIPGLTTLIGAINFLLVAQMIAGRSSVWLPGFITKRQLSTTKLCNGIQWLRKPVRFVERFLRPRLEFMFHRPWLWVPLVLILCLSMFMPFLEIIPMSGSLASAVIAIFAAGLLTRDGFVVSVALALVVAGAGAVWTLWP